MSDAEYFVNHARKDRFPWSLYHRPLLDGLARVIATHPRARVLIVGCGLEPFLPGVPDATFYACDIDARAVEEAQRRFPSMRDRLAVCPSPAELPAHGPFADPFDVVLAKEVVEHLIEPAAWAQELASRVAIGGSLALTTPNYGIGSTLGLLEQSVLEWIARRDGYSRKHIHPSKFTRRTLAALDVGPGMELVSIEIPWTQWTLLAHWRRVR